MNRAFVYSLLITGLFVAPALGQKISTKPSKDETAKDTVIQESSFRLVLPGKWVQKPSTDPTRWVYGHDTEQLTVSLPLGNVRRLTKDEQSKTLGHLEELYRRAEIRVDDTTATTTSETIFAEADGVLAARFGGTHPAEKHRFAILLLCSPSVVASFYYEAFGLTSAGFDANGRTIMNSIVIPR